MSATVETNTASWRKRLREDDTTQMDLKKPRYYYRLESESSRASEEDTESVYSLQGRETDVVRDTTDTDTDSKSEHSDQDEYEVHYEEYEVASLSGSEHDFIQSHSSSDSEDMMLAAAAAVICDSSLETWITDWEDSDNSSLEDTSFERSDFATCIQCKSENDNPHYRYCEKCFQDRKKFYPPRPKRNKKSRKDKKEPPVKLDRLQSCLKDLSQDSGIGSSQEWPALDLSQIVVPDQHTSAGTSQISTITESSEKIEGDTEKKSSGDVSSSLEQVTGSSSKNLTNVEEVKATNDRSCLSSTDTSCNVKKGRKRHLSESSISDFESRPNENKIPKLAAETKHPNSLSQTSSLGSEISSSSFLSSNGEKTSTSIIEGLKSDISENLELCILCNDAPKDAIFLHSKVAHQCCCYKCAKRTIKTTKRCPICNIAVNKVFKVIKS